MYKKVYKNVFIDGHKQLDIIENQNYFLTKIEKLKLYMVECNKNSAIKAKDYLANCVVRREKSRPIIVITHDECIFYANDGI